MKKTISIITLLLFILIIATVVVACDNKFTAGDYNIAIVFMQNRARTYEIESWRVVGSRQIQLRLKSGGVMLVDSVNCILYKGNIEEIPKY